MREIKFRQPLWDEHNKFAGWHYWGFIDGIFIEPAGTPGSSLRKAREQSQQFTGLHDKKGKEVNKGDWLGSRYFTAILVVDQISEGANCGQWVAKQKDGGYQDLHEALTTDGYEVIDNIHEHPELNRRPK